MSPADHHLLVHVLVELIVVAVVALERRRIVQDRLYPERVALLIALLRARLGGEVVVDRLVEQRRVEELHGHHVLLDVEREVRRLAGVRPQPVQRDVVGVHERGDDEPGLGVAPVVELLEEALGLLGEADVPPLLAGRH